MAYDDDYPTEPIGGGNPYYRCAHCKRAMPEINGNLQKHESWCPYRLMKEGGMLSEEQLHELATNYFADQWAVGKAIMLMQQVEAEVRKRDEVLIRQMLDALENMDQTMPFPVARQAITASRARLAEKLSQ